MIWTKAFWKGTGERSIKTFFQTWVAAFGIQVGAEALTPITPDVFIALPWVTASLTGGVAALLSVMTSIGSADFVAGELPRRALIEPVLVARVEPVGDTPPAELVPAAEHVTDRDVTRLTDWHDQHNGKP